MFLKYIYYIIILCISIRYYICLCKDYSPKSKFHNKSFGNSNESIKTLLDRIDWANNYYGRLNITPRFMICSIVSVFLISIFLQNALPNPLLFTQCIFICYLVNRSIYLYCRHHCDKFSAYGIDRNLKILRKKLKLKKGEVNIQKKKFKSSSKCASFVYSSKF